MVFTPAVSTVRVEPLFRVEGKSVVDQLAFGTAVRSDQTCFFGSAPLPPLEVRLYVVVEATQRNWFHIFIIKNKMN